MFKQCLIVLGFKDAYSSNYNSFQEENCPHQSDLFPKYGLLSWMDIILWCIQKKNLCICEGNILRAYIYHVFFFKNIFWKGHCVCKRVHFWHKSRLRHDLLQWDVLPFEKTCTCWREHSLQRNASLLFKGIIQSILTCVNFRVWPNNVNINISSTHSLAANVFGFVKHTFWKLTWTNKIA